jgi:(2S)-methylsuccinyl-CoA dehydrogenase
MSDQLSAAAAAAERAAQVVDAATRQLAQLSSADGRLSLSRLDEHQVLAYDIAHAASAIEGSRVMLDYGAHGEQESMLARAYVADAIWDVGT